MSKPIKLQGSFLTKLQNGHKPRYQCEMEYVAQFLTISHSDKQWWQQLQNQGITFWNIPPILQNKINPQTYNIQNTTEEDQNLSIHTTISTGNNLGDHPIQKQRQFQTKPKISRIDDHNLGSHMSSHFKTRIQHFPKKYKSFGKNYHQFLKQNRIKIGSQLMLIFLRQFVKLYDYKQLLPSIHSDFEKYLSKKMEKNKGSSTFQESRNKKIQIQKRLNQELFKHLDPNKSEAWIRQVCSPLYEKSTHNRDVIKEIKLVRRIRLIGRSESKRQVDSIDRRECSGIRSRK